MTSTLDGKRILLLGGKERLVPAVDRARELGLTVLVADGNPAAPGLKAADPAASTRPSLDIFRDEKSRFAKPGTANGSTTKATMHATTA